MNKKLLYLLFIFVGIYNFCFSDITIENETGREIIASITPLILDEIKIEKNFKYPFKDLKFKVIFYEKDGSKKINVILYDESRNKQFQPVEIVSGKTYLLENSNSSTPHSYIFYEKK